MSYNDFLDELTRAGLTVRAFAELIGMNPNSITNYARAQSVPAHLALIATLIAELSVHGINYRSLIAKIEIAPKKPRGRARQGQFGGDPQAVLDLDA